MRQHRAEPLDLQVKDETVKIPRLLHERVLDEDVAIVRHLHVVGEMLHQAVVNAILGPMLHTGQVVALGALAQTVESRTDSLSVVLECLVGHMRRCDDMRQPPLSHALKQGNRGIGVGRAVVDAGYHMAMHIGMEEERLALTLASEYIEHMT